MKFASYSINGEAYYLPENLVIALTQASQGFQDTTCVHELRVALRALQPAPGFSLSVEMDGEPLATDDLAWGWNCDEGVAVCGGGGGTRGDCIAATWAEHDARASEPKTVSAPPPAVKVSQSIVDHAPPDTPERAVLFSTVLTMPSLGDDRG